MAIIQNLWDMLNAPGDHFSIVQLLKRYDLLLARLFSDVVTMELNSQSSEVKLHAVEKFTVFWKLTAKDYNHYKPFQPEVERNRRLKSGINRSETMFGYDIDAEQSDMRAMEAEGKRHYVALHNMLLILDDPDPTLRLKCRSWLQDSKASFLRILDPILKEFMTNSRMFKSGSGQLFYMENYDADVVIENFSKMRNIILTTQD